MGKYQEIGDFKKINDFIDKTLKESILPNEKSLNIYKGEGDDAKIRRENLRFYLKKMRILNPMRLFVGEAPGRLGCFWTGIPFTDIETLIGNKFFQKRKKELVDSILGKEFKRKEIKELKNFIISYCKDKKDDIKKIFGNNSFEKRKEELKESISDYYKSKGIKKRVVLACSIINSHREKEVKFETEEIRERVELTCSIIDSCTEDGVTIDDISETTSSTVWECLDKLDVDQLPLLWNIYPFQPCEDGEKGKKNREAEDDECDEGVKFLIDLLDCFPSIKYIHAVGRKSEKALERKMYFYMRHPAKGGASEFKRQFSELYKLNQTI